MLNHIDIMGRLVRAPELRHTGSGISVAGFCIACDRDKKSGEEKEVDFVECAAWRQTGEFISKYFRKGDMIALNGRLEMRKWTDKDGNNRTTAQVNVYSAYFCGKKDRGEEGETAPAERFSPAEAYAPIEEYDDQLPF